MGVIYHQDNKLNYLVEIDMGNLLPLKRGLFLPHLKPPSHPFSN